MILVLELILSQLFRKKLLGPDGIS